MARVLERLQAKIRKHARLGVERTYVYNRRATALLPRVERAGGTGLTVDVVAPSSLHLLATIGPADLAENCARIERGDRCYGVWIDDELVHYSWVQDRGAHPIDTAALSFEIADGDFWIYNCRTADAHRGKGIYPRTLHRIVADYAAAGAYTAWIYTATDNLASQRGVLKLGFAQVATLRALRIGGYVRRLDDDVHGNDALRQIGRLVQVA